MVNHERTNETHAGAVGRHPYSNSEPFVVNPEGGGVPWIAYSIAIGSGEKLVASVDMCAGATQGYPRVETQDETEANARLIAAAPRMAAVLQRAAHILAEINQSKELSILALRSEIIGTIKEATPEYYGIVEGQS